MSSFAQQLRRAHANVKYCKFASKIAASNYGAALGVYTYECEHPSADFDETQEWMLQTKRDFEECKKSMSDALTALADLKASGVPVRYSPEVEEAFAREAHCRAEELLEIDAKVLDVAEKTPLSIMSDGPDMHAVRVSKKSFDRAANYSNECAKFVSDLVGNVV
jgi:hypothetical protein